jgi:DnaJ family protein A protein 5
LPAEAIGAQVNFYRVLDVEQQATAEAIKRSFRAASLKIHPDKCTAERATEAFQRLNEAFMTLTDADERRWHDEELAAQRRQREEGLQKRRQRHRGGNGRRGRR